MLAWTLPAPNPAGLSGEPPAEQVRNALALSQELVEVANNMITSDVGKMQLSVGIHSTAAQVGRAEHAMAVYCLRRVVHGACNAPVIMLLAPQRTRGLLHDLDYIPSFLPVAPMVTCPAGSGCGHQPPRALLHWTPA
jgi:hypothetical protein